MLLLVYLSSSPRKSFVLSYPFGLSLMFISFPYLDAESFFFGIRLFICFHGYSADLSVEFSLLFGRSCFASLFLFRYFFSFTSIASIFFNHFQLLVCPVGWGYRIHWLQLCVGVRPPPPPPPTSVLDMTLFDAEASVMLKLWEKQSTPILTSLLGPLGPGEVAPDRVLSIG